MLFVTLQAVPGQGISITGIIIIVVTAFFVMKMLLKLLKLSGLGMIMYRIIFYISRQNGTPGSPFAVYSLLMFLKSAFKKGLKKETYRNITNWNIVHEIANRYHCSFLLYGNEFSFTVIADSLSNLDFEDLDIEGIEELDKR